MILLKEASSFGMVAQGCYEAPRTIAPRDRNWDGRLPEQLVMLSLGLLSLTKFYADIAPG